MKRILLVLALALPGTSFATFIDGSKLMSWLDAPRGSGDAALGTGYVLGVADAYDSLFFCLPDSVRSKQVEAMVKKHLRGNPAKWNKYANDLVLEALQGDFPCAKK